MMLQQQQAAFQTMPQFGVDQGNQNAAFTLSAPAMASAPAIPAAQSMAAAPAIAPAVMSQPAAAMAPSSLPGMHLYHLWHSLAHSIDILSIKETILHIFWIFLSQNLYTSLNTSLMNYVLASVKTKFPYRSIHIDSRSL